MKNIFSNLNAFFIITLFIWISLFPASILNQYNSTIKIFLFLAFLDLWAVKGNSIFKLRSLPLWFFVISSGLNPFFAINKGAAWIAYLNIALPMVFIYYMASEDFSNKPIVTIFIKTISMLSILVSLLGIVEFIFAFNPIYEYFIKNPYYKGFIGNFVKPASTQMHPKVLATYLVLCLPFNFLLFKQDKSFLKTAGGIGAVFNIAVIILTFSQMALLGVVAMGGFYLFIQRKYSALRLFLSVLLAVSFISSFFPYPLNIFSINYLMLDKGSIFSISNFMKFFYAMDAIRQHPFVGLGFTNMNSTLGNAYFTVLASTGIIGFTGFFIFITYLIRKSLRALKILDYNSQERWFLVVTLTSFLGLLIDVSGYDFIYWPNPYLYFCILAGLISALCKKEEIK